MTMDKIPFRISPMLATRVGRPSSKEGWGFEEKYDGVRMLAYKEGPKVPLISRNGIDRSNRYPTIAAEVAKLNAKALLLDGEIVVFDARRVSRFQLLQQGKGKTQFAVFDCLYQDGKDLRREALSARRKVLEQVVKSGATVEIAKRLANDGFEAFEV